MSKHDQATVLWDHHALIVRNAADLSEQDKDALARMVAIAPELTLFRQFKQPLYRLCEQGISQQTARARRTRLVNNAHYQANPVLARALKKLANDRFEKMIVFLRWDTVERTNNHVERTNRGFRMLQNTR
jgi:hypothetical protein